MSQVSLSSADTAADHAIEFVEYYERASSSTKTIDRFARIRDYALALLQQRGNVPAVLQVADIGCGAGTQSMLWAELGHKVSALDASDALVGIGRKRASERGLLIRFDTGLAQSLPYESESFDVVLLPELLEHVADWEGCLSEAARTLRPGGVLYLSTTNRLCPVQQEFNLPLYSWYPSNLKRWCERKATTTRPEWANHTKYPAVNWFTYFELQQWFSSHGIETLDRFDARTLFPLSFPSRQIVGAIRRFDSIRMLAQIATEGTTVWGVKRLRSND